MSNLFPSSGELRTFEGDDKDRCIPDDMDALIYNFIGMRFVLALFYLNRFIVLSCNLYISWVMRILN